MNKRKLILWIVGALFFISSVPLFAEGNIAAGVCGVVIAAVLILIGFRKKAAAPAPKEAPSARPAPAPVANESTPPSVQPETPSAPPAPAPYEFLKTKVAGVTFKNGRKSRQTILRKIYWKEEPFDKGDMELTVERGEWEGKPAFGVFVNGEQIGSVPAEHVQFVADNFSRLDGITHIEVYGGGEGRNYGAEITLRFRNE